MKSLGAQLQRSLEEGGSNSESKLSPREEEELDPRIQVRRLSWGRIEIRF